VELLLIYVVKARGESSEQVSLLHISMPKEVLIYHCELLPILCWLNFF